MSNKTFALRSERKYPMDTIGRARNARARVVQHGTQAQVKRVFAATHRKYKSLPTYTEYKKGK